MTLRSIKLYFKTTLNPIMMIFPLLFTIGLPIAMAYDPSPKGDKEYMAMIAAVGGTGQFGVLIFQLMGLVSRSSCKFFLSAPDGRRLVTVIPTVVTLVMSLIYDALICGVSACVTGGESLPDMLLMCAVGTVAVCFAVSFFGKGRLELVFFFCAIFVTLSGVIIGRSSRFSDGFGLTAGKSAAVSAAILVAGLVINLVIQSIWWKKADRVSKRANTVMTMAAAE